MSNADMENGEKVSLKDKEFDEACALAPRDEDVNVLVYRKPEGTGRWDFCFGCLPGEYDELGLLQKIAEEYGAGEFPVQIKSKQDDGRPLLLWQKNMHVVPRKNALARPQPSTAAALPSNDGLAIAIENQTRMLGAVFEKMAQPAPAPAPETSRQDILAELASMKKLFGGESKSTADTVKEALELVNLLKGGDGSDPLTKALDMFGPKIVEELDAQKNQPTRAAPATQQLAASGPTPIPQPTFAHIDVATAFSVFAENYMTRLLSIPGEPSPEDLGKYIARLVGDNAELLHIVGLVIAQDDIVERLAQFDARVMGRAEWIDSIADWLAHALWPDTNPAPVPENGTFDTASDEKTDSQGINGANSDGAGGTGSEADPNAQDVKKPGEPGTSTSPGQLDNDT